MRDKAMARKPTPADDMVEAARQGRLDEIKAFLNAGVEIEAEDYIHHTALRAATLYNQEEVVRLLLERGAKADGVDDNGESALIIAARSAQRFGIAGLLVSHGASVNLQGKTGNTALLAAVRSRCFETAAFFVENGADLNVRDRDGRTIPEIWPRAMERINEAVDARARLREERNLAMQQMIKNSRGQLRLRPPSR
jgi:ankyrin repeat protein